VDLPAALRNPRHRDNLILVDRDSIVIPTYNAVVRVTGAVNADAALPYVKNRDIEYYIRAAGGPSRNADLSHAYVIQPSGKLETVQRRHFMPDVLPRPRAGARVVVPERTQADQRDLTQYLTIAAQLAGTITAVIAALVAIRR
jgi:polysaccharide biosynthesis/export protein